MLHFPRVRVGAWVRASGEYAPQEGVMMRLLRTFLVPAGLLITGKRKGLLLGARAAR
jgi:hypothetical protein